jgi:hypothetical protein
VGNVTKSQLACAECRTESNESIIHRMYRQALQSEGITFDYEQKFDDCYLKKRLRFDFSIPELKLELETDGALHFYISKDLGGMEALKYCRQRDHIKNEYIASTGRNMARISDNLHTREHAAFILSRILDMIRFNCAYSMIIYVGREYTVDYYKTVKPKHVAHHTENFLPDDPKTPIPGIKQHVTIDFYRNK